MKKAEKENTGFKQFVITLLVGTLIVMALPILNGGPVIYSDTPAYLKHAARFLGILFSSDGDISPALKLTSEQQVVSGSDESYKVITSGRSLYYGLFLYIGWKTSLWLPIAVQAGVLTWLSLLLFKFASPVAWPYKAIATLFFVSIFSSASFFSGLLMPDIWAGITVLAVALLWAYGNQLSTWSKLFILAVMAFSVLVHASHLVLLAAMMTVFSILWFLDPKRDEPLTRTLALPAAALSVGIMGMVAWSLAVTVGYKAKILQRPFITAHLADMGPGARYLKHSCPESGFALCEFENRLPIDWANFLFDPSPETGVFGASPVEAQLALAEEQIAFAISVLASEPVATISGLIGDGLRQLWTLSLSDVALSQKHSDVHLERIPEDIIEQMRETAIYKNPNLSSLVERHSEILATFSALILGVWLILRLIRRNPEELEAARLDHAIAILIAGVVLNALICGILASPYGRFQARIVWILPLIASLILASKVVALENPKWLPRLGLN